MKWDDIGVVIATKAHGENGLIVHILTQEHGLHAGMMKGRKKHAPLSQPGTVLQLTWSARMEEHLGFWNVELRRSVPHIIANDQLRLYALNAITHLLYHTLPERYPCEPIYTHYLALNETLQHGQLGQWGLEYVQFQLDLLAWLGYGLDLTHCAATGDTHELVYVSPKSGRAVSKNAGEPFADKLLPLANFLQPQSRTQEEISPVLMADTQQIIDGLRLSHYFFHKYIFAPQEKTLPMSCQLFLHSLRQMHTNDTAPITVETPA